MFPSDLNNDGSEFERVRAITEKTLVSMFVLETKVDSRSCLGFLARGSGEYKYAGCLDKNILW